MSISQKLTQIAENVSKVYGMGEAAAKAACEEKHFITTVAGAGGTELTFACPFQPDRVLVSCYWPSVYKQENVIAMFVADRRSFSHIGGGAVTYRTNGNVSHQGLTVNALTTRCTYNENGTVTLGGVTGASGAGVFAEGAPYVVSAVRYADETDRQRITQYVQALTGSGAAALNGSKVDGAFETFPGAVDGRDSEAWADLIATKPDWTFTLS